VAVAGGLQEGPLVPKGGGIQGVSAGVKTGAGNKGGVARAPSALPRSLGSRGYAVWLVASALVLATWQQSRY